jgi:hypothetical protein
MTPCFLEKATLDEEVFCPLKEKFVGLGILLEEMWDLVMPETPDMLHGFGGRPETMAKLKKFLRQRPLGRVFTHSDRFWAERALDKYLGAQNAQWHMAPSPSTSACLLTPPRPLAGEDQRSLSTPSLPESITAPSQNSEPSDEELSKAVQDYLSTQDLGTFTLRCVVLPLGR